MHGKNTPAAQSPLIACSLSNSQSSHDGDMKQYQSSHDGDMKQREEAVDGRAK
jgi:hypothetical protein